MNIFRRAYLYIMRKRARSIILLVIMTVLGLFALVGLTIRTSAKQAADDVRKSLRTGIAIECMPLSEDVFERIPVGDHEVLRKFKIPLFTQEALDQILQTDGIEGYCVDEGQEILYTGLETIPGAYTKTQAWLAKEDPDRTNKEYTLDWSSGEAAIHSNSFRIVSEGRWYPAFMNGALEMTKGRNIEANDKGKAVISKELAMKNNLNIGDKITSSCYDFVTGKNYGSEFVSEIVGIFRINFEQDLSNWTPESSILSNVIFADLEIRNWANNQYYDFAGWDTLASGSDYAIGDATFYVEDVEMLDTLKKQILSIDTVDWSYYNVKEKNDEYRAAASPLRTMITLSTILVVIIVAGALIILSLLLTMWIKSRQKEIGIFTILGMKKRTILGQFLLECGLIGAGAFLIALVLAAPLTNAAGKAMESFVSVEEGGESYKVVMTEGFDIASIDKVPVGKVSLEYRMSWGVLVAAFGVMILVMTISVVTPSLRILKRKPREILL